MLCKTLRDALDGKSMKITRWVWLEWYDVDPRQVLQCADTKKEALRIIKVKRERLGVYCTHPAKAMMWTRGKK